MIELIFVDNPDYSATDSAEKFRKLLSISEQYFNQNYNQHKNQLKNQNRTNNSGQANKGYSQNDKYTYGNLTNNQASQYIPSIKTTYVPTTKVTQRVKSSSRPYRPRASSPRPYRPRKNSR